MLLMYVATQWNVQGMPTFIIIKDAKELERVVGANQEELEKRVAYHVQHFHDRSQCSHK